MNTAEKSIEQAKRLQKMQAKQVQDIVASPGWQVLEKQMYAISDSQLEKMAKAKTLEELQQYQTKYFGIRTLFELVNQWSSIDT